MHTATRNLSAPLDAPPGHAFTAMPLLQAVPLVAALLLAAVSVTVMVGWLIESTALVQISLQYAPMQFNTATCFLAAAIALLLIHHAKWQHAYIPLAYIFVLSSLTLFEYVSGRNLGIDTLFIEPFTFAHASYPGRMSPPTAVAFFSSSAALLLCLLSRRIPQKAAALCRIIASIMALSAFSLSVAVLCSYAIGADYNPIWAGFTRMAAHTALCFNILSIATCAIVWQLSGAQRIDGIPLYIPLTIGSSILIINLLAPRSVVISILYLFLVVSALFIRLPAAPIVLACVASFLTLFGYANAPDKTMNPEYYSINHILAVCAQWVVALLVYFSNKSRVVLEQEREQMQATLNNVFGAIITIDQRGIVQMFNPTAERIFGYSASEVVGRNINMLMPEPYRSEHDDYLHNYHSTSQAHMGATCR